jgi:hypothetical protein
MLIDNLTIKRRCEMAKIYVKKMDELVDEALFEVDDVLALVEKMEEETREADEVYGILPPWERNEIMGNIRSAKRLAKELYDTIKSITPSLTSILKRTL